MNATFLPYEPSATIFKNFFFSSEPFLILGVFWANFFKVSQKKRALHIEHEPEHLEDILSCLQIYPFILSFRASVL